MALKATIFKVELNIADMDRNYYQDHVLTIARHPSESDERMMRRILAFAMHAQADLCFTKGLCVDDEPDLWQKNLADDIEVWIDLGQPDEKRLKKACGRAKQVYVYPYNTRSATVWWQQMESKLARFNHLKVIHLPEEQAATLVKLAKKNMCLQCSVQEGEIWLGDEDQTVHIRPDVWK